MLNGWKLAMVGRRAGLLAAAALVAAGAWGAGVAQEAKAAGDGGKPHEVYAPIPGFDTTSIDKTADPCNDFYKFACGKFAANHPIPSDQPGVDQFYALYNVNTQSLNGIVTKAAAGGTTRSAEEQKIGDYYAACMNTDLIEQKGLNSIQPLLDEINGLGNGDHGKQELAAVAGKLQR